MRGQKKDIPTVRANQHKLHNAQMNKPYTFHIQAIVTAIAFLAAMSSCHVGRCDFDSNFTGETLRIDYYSEGTASTETAELISLRKYPGWNGPRKNLIDHDNLGEYRITLADSKTGDTLYCCGFCTLFGEWRTTDEARTKTEKYCNVNRVPMPRRSCIITVSCRNKRTMEFEPIGEFRISPSDVTDADLASNKTYDITINGNNTEKVDLTFLAEGYRKEETEKFLSDVRRFQEALFNCPPFDTYRTDFNVRAVMLDSDSSGTDHPGIGIFRDTPLNSEYYTFGTDRYLTTKDMKSVIDAIWDTPTDAIFILVNEPVYGGGGIYNFYAIGSADNKRTLDVFIHEFGHSFGALADEYFYSETPYGEDVFYCLESEPWEPNITTLRNFGCKWADLLPDGAEIPTQISDSSNIPPLGVFEGGGYLTKGIYRPADHCMMRDYAPFCKACSRSIIRNINFTCDR